MPSAKGISKRTKGIWLNFIPITKMLVGTCSRRQSRGIYQLYTLVIIMQQL